jgi:septal ring factor EnvC (AmiA/AmiB activator)
MQSETQALPIEGSGVDAPPKFGGDEESDLMQIVQEMQRRMAHLESRLDESNAARERLERQVAAQSEELRVQRAAIARTQRALRGLTRSEEEATEPALRAPAKGANPGA